MSTRLQLRVPPGAARSVVVDRQIVSGHASRDKIVAPAALEPDETERLLSAASGAGKERP